MLVLVIMLIVVAGVAPSLARTMPRLAVRRAARMVFATAERAHSESVARAVRFRLVLDLSQGTLAVTAETDPLADPGQYADLPEHWARQMTLPSRTRIESVEITGEATEILTAGECELMFWPDGTATDAVIALAADDGSQEWVVVRGTTGRVEIRSEPPS